MYIVHEGTLPLETTIINYFQGEEQELGQIGKLDLFPILWKRSLMTLTLALHLGSDAFKII